LVGGSKSTRAEAAGFNALLVNAGFKFENLDYGEPSLDGLPLMYVFYADELFTHHRN
jgi:hypothetical protein